MYSTKAVLISLALFITKNSFAQPEHLTTDQNEVEKCSSDKKVCGTDGKTYSNLCVLQKETGVKLAHEGDCTSGKDGKKETPYRPDLILKSKIVNTTEESLQKKLVKHFNPITGKWEYVVEILPTIVITPTFHHLQMAKVIQAPCSHNITNTRTNACLETVGTISAPTKLDVNNTIPTYLGKTPGGIFPKERLIVNNSQGPFNTNEDIISEIVRNVTKNFPSSLTENRIVPIKNKIIPLFNTSMSHPNQSHPNVFPSRVTSTLTGKKSPVHRLQTVVNKPKSLDLRFITRKLSAREKLLPFNRTNQTNLQKPLPENPEYWKSRPKPVRVLPAIPFNRANQTQLEKRFPGNHIIPGNPEYWKIRPKPVLAVPPLDTFKINELEPPFKDALHKNDSTSNYSNEMPPKKIQTLPKKAVIDNITDFLKNESFDAPNNELPKTLHGNATNESLDAPNNELPKTLHGNATKPPKETAGYNSFHLLNYKLKNYQIPVPIKNETMTSFNTSKNHPNRSHPNLFPLRVTSTLTRKKSPVHRLQTVVNKPKSFDLRFILTGNELRIPKHLPFNQTNQTNLQKPLPENRTVQGKSEYKEKLVGVIPVVPPLESFSIPEMELPFKDALFENNSFRNLSNEMQPSKKQTLPVRLDNIIDFRRNGSSHKQINEMPRNATKPLQATAGNNPPEILNYKPKNYQIPKRTNVKLDPLYKPKSHHHQLRYPNRPLIHVPRVVIHRDSVLQSVDQETNDIFKTNKTQSLLSYPTTINNVTHNVSQPIINITDIKPLLNVSQSHGKGTFPATSPENDEQQSAVNISHSIDNVTETKPSEKVYDHHVRNVSQSTRNGSFTVTPHGNDSHSPAVNIIQPISITGLKDHSTKDEYNSTMNTSLPIKEGPESGDHSSGNLNITPQPKKPEEIIKMISNNDRNTHPIQPSFHPKHSKQQQFAVRIPKRQGWAPLKNIPSIIENQEENIDQTKPNTDTKTKSNTKWGTYNIKLPGNISDYMDLVLNWEVLQLTTNQPNLTINVSEVIGRKNYTWPRNSKYTADTSIYYKLRSDSLKPVNEKIQRTVGKGVWHNTDSRHPQFLVNTKKTVDIPINFTKTAEIKTYQLEDEMELKENMKSGLLTGWKERKKGAYRYVGPSLRVNSTNFGHNLEKYGSYTLELPSNIAGKFKLIFSWTLKNKISKSIRAPIDITEKLIKYDYKWNIGDNNKGGQPIGNEKIQPIKSIKFTGNKTDQQHKTPTSIKSHFGVRRITGRKNPGRRVHNQAHVLGNVHLDIPTTIPHLVKPSNSVKTEKIRPPTNLYPGWYYMEMLFNVPVDGGGSADSNKYTNQKNYGETKKPQMNLTKLLTSQSGVSSLLPSFFDYPSFLNKYAIAHARAHEGKCNHGEKKTKG